MKAVKTSFQLWYQSQSPRYLNDVKGCIPIQPRKLWTKWQHVCSQRAHFLPMGVEKPKIILILLKSNSKMITILFSYPCTIPSFLCVRNKITLHMLLYSHDRYIAIILQRYFKHYFIHVWERGREKEEEKRGWNFFLTGET